MLVYFLQDINFPTIYMHSPQPVRFLRDACFAWFSLMKEINLKNNDCDIELKRILKKLC
jgi:hypothetical protein